MTSTSQQTQPREVVITGVGVVSPIGIGRDAFWASLMDGRSGVCEVTLFDTSAFPVHIGAEVADFDPKAYVRPRKSLKVMSREIQFGFAAADLALADARLEDGRVEPDRYGVVFGAEMIYCDLAELEPAYRACIQEGRFDFQRWGTAMQEVYPLWMLRNLPNMVACQIAIAHDARGPNNTIGHSDVSSLGAIIEAARVIERDHADVMIAGGVGARIQPTSMSYRGAIDLSRRNEEPARACRPFDAERDGTVHGEGAAAFVLESRQHAQQRGARVLARIGGYASAHEVCENGTPLRGQAVRQAIRQSLQAAGMEPGDVGHVNAHGLATVADDRYEAQAIRAELGDVPVTALKGYLGHSGAGCGALELAGSVVALEAGAVPATLNCERPDPECPVNVIRGQPLRGGKPTALKLSASRLGQAMALVIESA